MTEKLQIIIDVEGKKATTTINGVAAGLSKVGKVSKKAEKGLKKVDHAAHGAHGSMGDLVASMVSMSAVFAGFKGFQAVIKSSLDMQSIMSKLSVGTDDAAKEFERISDIALRLGLDLRTTADDYSNLTAASIGTALEGKATRDIFEGIATASTALNLSADQTSGALKAIEQMMSKGNVQAEELRGQLGERLPGAFNLAAEAMGVSTGQLNKMLDKGEVLASDLLPRLADVLKNKFGPAAESAALAPQAQFNRLSTAVFRFNETIGEHGATQAVANLSGVMAELFATNEELAKSIGESLVNGMEYAIVGASMLAKGFEGISLAMDASRVVLDSVVLTTVEGFDIMLVGLEKFYDALSNIPGDTGLVYKQAAKDIKSFRKDIDNVKQGIVATGGETLKTLENDYTNFGKKVDEVSQKMFTAIEKARGKKSVKITKRAANGTTSPQDEAVSKELIASKKIIDINSAKFEALKIMADAAFADEFDRMVAQSDAKIALIEGERAKVLDAVSLQIEDETARREALAQVNAFYDQKEIDVAQKTADAIDRIDKKRAKSEKATADKHANAKFDATKKAFSDIAVLMNTESRKLFEIGKVAAIANATMDTYESASSVYKNVSKWDPTGGVIAASFAAAAVIAGIAKVKAIASTSFGSKGAGVAAGGGTPNVGGGGVGLGGGISSPPPPVKNQSPQSTVTVFVNGVISQDQLTNDIIPAALKDLTDNKDVVLFGPQSAQAKLLAA